MLQLILVQATETGSIEGKVTDAVGNPIKGARVTLDDEKTAITDSDGDFKFRGVFEGDHRVTAEFKGVDRTESVFVIGGETSFIMITMPIYPE